MAAACRVPGLVRRLSWQRLMAALADTAGLAYLVDGVAKKYGLEPDQSPVGSPHGSKTYNLREPSPGGGGSREMTWTRATAAVDVTGSGAFWPRA